jgi:outer membrane lipoprotein-sorting protein
VIRIVRLILFVVIATALWTLSLAQEPPVLQTVRSVYSGASSLDVSFSLHIVWKVREKEETQSGHIQMAPGEKFRVDLGSLLWVSDGTTLWQEETSGKSKQVVVKNLTDVDIDMHPSHILSAYLDKNTFRTIGETGSRITVESVVAQKNADIQLLRCVLDKKTGYIQSLLAIDRSGNESTYTFKKTKTGCSLNKKLFSYSAPKGVKVIDMR